MLSDVTMNSVGFGRLQIAFDQRVLRPRDWTAAQSAWAAELIPGGTESKILELCCGAGQIGLLALALSSSSASLVAVDANPAACEFTRLNATAAGLLDRVEIRQGALDSTLGPGELFDVVIADPPWVPREHVPRFPQDPQFAIDGGERGLEPALSCLSVAEEHLADGGSLVLQLGSQDQADQVEDWLRDRWSTLHLVEVRSHEPSGTLLLLRKAGSLS